jgi:type I restriction enzyme M protein
MNMILHDNPTASIAQGNTLANPAFKTDHGMLRTFDFVVANPPFSDKKWITGLDPQNDPFERFDYFGIPPDKQGDYAYLLHIVASLRMRGKGACILPHGVLFRGNAEADIRRKLLCRGYIKGIIGLPANLFYGTGIPACIIVINKEGAESRDSVFMIDAGKGFIKDGNKNRLRSQDLHKIVDVFNKGIEVAGYSRLVPLSEIADKNDYNLNIPRYIDSQQAEDIQDIDGHLRGGIPARDLDALARYWQICPDLKAALFADNRPGYLDLAVDKNAIKATIYQHPQFVAFMTEMEALFRDWRERSSATLKALQPGCHPKQVIHALGEELLGHYLDKPLIDAYAVYQHLMDYWAEVMQDDCYLIAAPQDQGGGWQANTYRLLETNKKGKSVDKGWACDLLPKALLVNRYYAEQQAAIAAQDAERESLEAQLTELEEEHAGDEGAFAELDKVNKANVTARLKELKAMEGQMSWEAGTPGTTKGDPDSRDEAAVLKQWQTLNTRLTQLKFAIKTADVALDSLAYNHYPTLTEDEIKILVVEDKWLASLGAAIHGEMDRISQRLSQRLKELAERYDTPLPQQTRRVAELEQAVSAHLERMGFAWA